MHYYDVFMSLFIGSGCQVAPPHVACSGIHDGANLDFYWNLFWVNPIPDAKTSVNLNINGTVMAFEGFGYHDQVSQRPMVPIQ